MRALGASRTSLVPGGVLAGPWVRDSLWRRARAVPSLDLRFADNKSLVDAVTGASLVTFTRASSKTVTNSARVLETVGIDVPAFDHDPTTGESLGLLVEEQRTNVLLRSEEFDNAYWTPIAVTKTANATTGPSSATTADLLTENSASSIHEIFVGNIGSAATHTFSIFLKNNSGNRHLNICFSFGSAQALSLRVNAATGSLSSIYTEGLVFSGATSTVTAYPNGWYRASITFAATAAFAVQIGLSTSSAAPPAGNFGLESYIGDGTSGIFIWGAQLEAGAFPTSYIPTTTAAVTRSADVCSITGSALSLWYRQDQGAIFIEGATSASAGNPVLVQFDDGTNAERILLRRVGANNSSQLFVVDGNANQAVVGVTTPLWNADIKAKICGVYATNDFNFAFNGTFATPDTLGTLPTVDRLSIGSASGGSYINQCIRRFTFWPQRLSNASLQAITQ